MYTRSSQRKLAGAGSRLEREAGAVKLDEVVMLEVVKADARLQRVVK
jgi:hypothetical protein